ncbi:unnamed protein product [Gulo gulo]|uniref:Uncharacterized protein n=1 Tax=Gulo gulo TaxID=48420 RepID=A0A9X9LEU3_GULGU|nr:unnamed protein product [Gulo gulo]
MCQHHKLRQTVLVPCRDGCHWLCLWLWLWFLGYPGRNHMPLPVQHDRLDHCSLLPPDLRRRRMRTQLCDHDCNKTICQTGKLTQTVPFICYNLLLG